jgi:hypothetical protein
MKPETKSELRGMLAEAEARMEQAEKEIARHREDFEAAKIEASQLRGILSRHGDEARSNGIRILTPVKDAVQRPVKFRDVIREAVDAALGPISIGDVTDYVKSKGFSEEGATPLAVRVGNELFRLSNLGEITRASRGHYESTK